MEGFEKEIMEEVVEVAAENVAPAALNEEFVKLMTKLGKWGVGIGVVVTAIILLFRKFGVKIDEAEARRLAKKGYVISKPEQPEEEEPKKDSKK